LQIIYVNKIKLKTTLQTVFVCVETRRPYYRWIVLWRQSRKCILRGNCSCSMYIHCDCTDVII